VGDRPSVAALKDFIAEHDLLEASIAHISRDFKKSRPSVGFNIQDVSEARRRLKQQPLTQKLPPLKEIAMETKKVVGLAPGTKPLPIEVKPHTIALAPKAPPVIVPPPPEPVKPPPPPVKPAVEPRLLLAPSGAVGSCTSANLSEMVDELARMERCDPADIVVYRPVKTRVTRLIEVSEE
jgi:hypothetical protein